MTASDLPARDSVPVRRPEMEWVDLDGEVVVYDTARARLHRLNTSAASVWSECDGTTTVEQVIAATVERYTGPNDEIARDVRDTLVGLHHAGLLDLQLDDQLPLVAPPPS